MAGRLLHRAACTSIVSREDNSRLVLQFRVRLAVPSSFCTKEFIILARGRLISNAVVVFPGTRQTSPARIRRDFFADVFWYSSPPDRALAFAARGVFILGRAGV
jgi:hypothetical protein